MIELKPCPFCGGEAVTRMECEPRRTMRPYGTIYTECRSCGASVGFAFVDAEDAEKAWNRRASDEPEIIRCKDCKWFGELGCAIRIVDDTDKPTENDYCSFAERRTDG